MNIVKKIIYKIECFVNKESTTKLMYRIKYPLHMAIRYYSNKKRVMTDYPTTIQLPITYLCNFDCVMCGMHQLIHKKDFAPKELEQILSDKLFQKVSSVGVNGGEPFLRSDIVDCFKVMINSLPNLKRFYVISNGYFTNKILDALSEIKAECSRKNIKLNVSFSVDGIDDMQDLHRGHVNAFKNVCNTLDLILEDKGKYADSVKIISTITKYNISRISEVDIWAKNLGIEITYNIATVNVRIKNEDREKDFSVFSDERARMLASEFFYRKYQSTKKEVYFAIFLFLMTGKRYDICPCMYNEWVTLTPDTQLGFCATHSKNLGSGLERSSYDIIQENIPYLEQLKRENCLHCSQYMAGLNTEGLKELYKDIMKNKFIK